MPRWAIRNQAKAGHVSIYPNQLAIGQKSRATVGGMLDFHSV